MQKIFVLIMVSFFAVSGCATFMAPSGPFVADGVIFGATKGPINATSNPSGTRTGTACAQNLFGLFAWGDNSIATAKKKAGITKVSNVDFNRFSVLGLFAKVCTTASGD